MATTAGQPLGRKRITRNGRDGAVARMRGGAERWLEAERDQLILWLPVALGLGIAAWFALPDRAQWVAFLLASAALGLGALAASDGGRLMRALAVAGLAMALGCALAWWRAERVAAPVLARPAVVTFTGDVERVDMLPAREMVRVWLRVPDAAAQGLPPRIRVNVATPDAPTLDSTPGVWVPRSSTRPDIPSGYVSREGRLQSHAHTHAESSRRLRYASLHPPASWVIRPTNAETRGEFRTAARLLRNTRRNPDVALLGLQPGESMMG